MNDNTVRSIKKNVNKFTSKHVNQDMKPKMGRSLSTFKKKWKGTPETIITICSVIFIFLLWYVIAKMEFFHPSLFPSPAATWAAFVEILVNGYKGNSLLYHWFDSMFRLFSAFFLALITAIPLGLWSGYSSKVRATLDPLIEFYRPIPPLAYYTMLILWFGIENASKISLLYLAAFPPMYIAAMSAVKGVLKDRIHSAESLGANRWQVFRYVIFPSCLSGIFTGIRTATGFTYTTLVAAEMVAAVSGIGWMVLDAGKFLRSDIILVGVFIMGLTGILLDRMVRMLENKVIPWKGKD